MFCKYSWDLGEILIFEVERFFYSVGACSLRIASVFCTTGCSVEIVGEKECEKSWKWKLVAKGNFLAPEVVKQEDRSNTESGTSVKLVELLIGKTPHRIFDIWRPVVAFLASWCCSSKRTKWLIVKRKATVASLVVVKVVIIVVAVVGRQVLSY